MEIKNIANTIYYSFSSYAGIFFNVVNFFHVGILMQRGSI